MRIISKSRDYYDCIQKHGQDQDLIFNREEKEISIPTIKICNDKSWWDRIPRTFYNTRDYSSLNMVIGFCGEIYPIIYLTRLTSSDKEPRTLYDQEEIKELVLQNTSSLSTKWYSRLDKKDPVRLNNFFELKNNTVLKNLFDEYRCPVYLLKFESCVKDTVHQYKTTLNFSNLQKYDFQKIIDPYQAFQKIEMFLSGLAAPNKPIPAVSNEDMIEAKGFNLKTSFRKESTKCKKK